jgi:hypothetical protein
MLNPIPKSDFFVTESIREVFDRIESLSNKKERAQAYQIAMTMMNACHRAVAEEILYNEVKDPRG